MNVDTPLRAYLRHLFKDEDVRTVSAMDERQILTAIQRHCDGPDIACEFLDGDDLKNIASLVNVHEGDVIGADYTGARQVREQIANYVLSRARGRTLREIAEILAELRADEDTYTDSAERDRDHALPARA